MNCKQTLSSIPYYLPIFALMIENELNNQVPEKAVLVGIITKHQSEIQLKEYLDELTFLAHTAGAETICTFHQRLDHPDIKTYVGSGKLEEINQYCEKHDVDLVIFDDEISPSQQRNIEKELKRKVLDRTMLILDIFASRAKTQQARTQVELAQMLYLLPRLKGMWEHLDRIKGGIGMRGAGEKEIETDRRIVQQKISFLKDRLVSIDKQTKIQSKQRAKMIRVSLVGYTNVGKSTIMNLLSKSEVLAENKLFATLDTTVRKVVLNQTPFLLSDTVGFIRKLPHLLVESFKSTLYEAVESDLLLHVVDVSHPNFEDQIKVVNDTLKELNALQKPTLLIFNKMDAFEQRFLDPFLTEETREELMEEMKKTWIATLGPEVIFISALKNINIKELRKAVNDKVKDLYQIRYPYKTAFYS